MRSSQSNSAKLFSRGEPDFDCDFVAAACLPQASFTPLFFLARRDGFQGLYLQTLK